MYNQQYLTISQLTDWFNVTTAIRKALFLPTKILSYTVETLDLPAQLKPIQYINIRLLTMLLIGGWNMNWIFPYIGNNHHPNWRTHIFQRGRYTTNQVDISSAHWFRSQQMLWCPRLVWCRRQDELCPNRPTRWGMGVQPWRNGCPILRAVPIHYR